MLRRHLGEFLSVEIQASKLRTCSPAAERETQSSASYYLVWRCRDMQSDKFLNGVVSRRHVVAAGLAPLIVPRHVLGGPGYQARAIPWPSRRSGSAVWAETIWT